MTIEDFLIKRGWIYQHNIHDDMGDYFLLSIGGRLRRYYHDTKILTDDRDKPIVVNPSLKLLWLMRLI